MHPYIIAYIDTPRNSFQPMRFKGFVKTDFEKKTH